MTISVIDYIGDGKLPVKCEIEYQKYRPAEEVDGLINPEVEPYVEILSTQSFGFSIDDFVTPFAMERLRQNILDKLVKKDLLEIES